MTELERAIRLRETGQLEQAQELLLRLTAEFPTDPAVWYQCAWVHDVMELEREAIPYYEQALALGLDGEDRKGAYLGLGSTYRTLGRYEEAATTLRQAILEYPGNREFEVFYAMVLYNLQDYSGAMESMLRQLAETSEDAGIRAYRRAILYYSDKLDDRWD